MTETYQHKMLQQKKLAKHQKWGYRLSDLKAALHKHEHEHKISLLVPISQNFFYSDDRKTIYLTAPGTRLASTATLQNILKENFIAYPCTIEFSEYAETVLKEVLNYDMLTSIRCPIEPYTCVTKESLIPKKKSCCCFWI